MDANLQPSEQQTQPEAPAVPACKHEFVRIYQRKLKGLERRLVATKAYLPVGFKMTDFGHLSEGSYCFCTKCRARLFPKRTAADKAAARQANLAKQALAEEAMVKLDSDSQIEAGDAAGDLLEAELGVASEDETEKTTDSTKSPETSASISVEELEIDALELDEISESGDIQEGDEEEP